MAWRTKNAEGTWGTAAPKYNPDGTLDLTSSGGTPDTGALAGAFGAINPMTYFGQGGTAAVDAGRDAYNEITGAYTQGAKNQQAAIQGAADSTRALGTEMRDWYTNANTQAQNYYSPAQGAYTEMQNNQPTQSQNAFGYLGGQLGGATNQEMLAAGPNYSTEQGIMQGYFGSQQGQAGPSQMRDLYGQQAGSAGPSQYRDFAAANQGTLAQQGIGEQYAGQRLAGGVQQGALGERYGQAQAFASGPDAVAQRYQQRQAGPQTGMLDAYAQREMQAGIPGASKSVFDSSNGMLSQPGYSENLFNADKYGTGQTDVEQLFAQRRDGSDPAAAYMDQRAMEAINNQLAARGRFNSGPGVRQISDYLANANAQRSQQLAGLAQASSTAAGQRANYRSALAGQTDSSRLQATGLRGQLANASDSINLQGRNYLGGLASGVDSNQIQRQGQLDTLANATSQSGLARQNMLNSVAGNLDDSRFRQQSALDALANQSQQFQLSRIGMGADLAQGASAEERAQQGYLAALAQGASGEGARQQDYLADLARAASGERAGQATFGLNAAQGADSSRLANNQLYGDLAQQASSEQSKYYGDLNNAALGLGQAQAGTMSGLYRAGGEAYSNAQLAAIEAEMKAKGMDTSVFGTFRKDLETAGKYF